MCLTTAALAAFLTLIGVDKVTTEPDRITVHAEADDVLWIAGLGEDIWCTLGPQLDKAARFSAAAEPTY